MIHEINISFLFSLELHHVVSCLYTDILLLLPYVTTIPRHLSEITCCEVFLSKSLTKVFSLLKDKIQSTIKSSGGRAIFFVCLGLFPRCDTIHIGISILSESKYIVSIPEHTEADV